MNFAILRTAKLKSASEIRGAGSHNARTRQTDNADPDRMNIDLVPGGVDLYSAVQDRIAKAGLKRKVRSDAVLAQEIFLSASPEYFRPDDPSQAGEWDHNRLGEWQDASLQWLKAEFGDNMIDCKLHLDESTPHIHAVVVPLVDGPKGQRLSAKEVFSKKTLSEMQTTYAKSLEPLGINRGLEGSKATHTDIKKFYGAVNDAQNQQIPVLQAPAKPMLREKTRQKYAEHINNKFRQELKPTFDKACGVTLVQKQKKQYQKTARAAELKAKAKTQQTEEIKSELQAANDAARDVPLTAVLENFGLETDPNDPDQWIGAGHRITTKKNKFYDHVHGQGGGGAIDLVMHLRDCDFKQAVAWLGQEISVEDAARAIRATAHKTAKACQSLDVSFHPPAKTVGVVAETSIRAFLNSQRGITPTLTEPLLKQGLIYLEEITKKGRQYYNVVFLAQNSQGVTGCERKGLAGRFFGTKGKRKDGAFVVGDSQSKKAVFVESAIDALSYYQLHGPDCYVISTAGATTAPPFVADMEKNGWQLAVGFDNDETGRNFALKFKIKFPKSAIYKPLKKDWNEDLKEFLSSTALDKELPIALNKEWDQDDDMGMDM